MPGVALFRVLAAELKETEPRDGFISSAAIRSRVVFPAPLWPSSATNSPDCISRETPRKAAREPNRFSIFWKEIPKPVGPFADGDAAVFGCAAKRFRLALNQAAYGMIHTRTLALIFVVGDGPGLMAQFEPEHAVFQFVHAAADFAR